MPAFTTKIDIHSEEFRKNTEQVGKLVENLKQKLQKYAWAVVKKHVKNTLNVENS